MNPLNTLQSLTLPQKVTITDTQSNTYTGTLTWTEETYEFKMNDSTEIYEIVPQYNENELYLINPIDENVLHGFFIKIKTLTPL